MLGIGVEQSGGPSPIRPGRVLATIAVVAFLGASWGCSGSGGDTGAGTIDIGKSKEAAGTNPEASKAAALRGKSGLGGAPLESNKKKGR